jgi:DNA-directed RNA polymerase subunit E'/Rpb7
MLVSPYKDVTQYTKIQIKPHMMNSDIQNIMKLVLRKKVEKRCNKNGFVDEVHRIETFEAEDMRPENLSGAVNFDISYHCRLCIPIENSLIIAQVKAINQELILAQNGPVMIFIPKDNIDQTVWDVTDKFMHLNDKSNLKVNNYIKVEVMNKRINQGDHQIKIIGQLLDLASEDEINNYYGSIITLDSEQVEEVEEQEESNFII